MATKERNTICEWSDIGFNETKAPYFNRFTRKAATVSGSGNLSGRWPFESSLEVQSVITDLSQEAEDFLRSHEVQALPSSRRTKLAKLLNRILLRLCSQPQTVLSLTVEDDDDDLDVVVVVLDRTRRSELRFRMDADNVCRFAVYRQGIKFAFGTLDVEDALFDSVIEIYRSISI